MEASNGKNHNHVPRKPSSHNVEDVTILPKSRNKIDKAHTIFEAGISAAEVLSVLVRDQSGVVGDVAAVVKEHSSHTRNCINHIRKFWLHHGCEYFETVSGRLVENGDKLRRGWRTGLFQHLVDEF